MEGFLVLRLTGKSSEGSGLAAWFGGDEGELAALDSIVVWWHVSVLVLSPFTAVVQAMHCRASGACERLA